MVDVAPEGTTTHRELYFVRESNFGEIESNPSYIKYSDTAMSTSTTINTNKEKQRGLNGVDPDDIRAGSENSTYTVTYFLQRWLSDTTADALDDAFTRTSGDSNLLPNSHGIYEITKRSNGGSAGEGIYTYTIGKGAKASTATITLDSSTGNPIQAEIEYQVQKLRSYQIDQPSGSGVLTFVSSDSDDSMDLTLEDNSNADTAETKSVNGTTEVDTTSSFSSLRGAKLASAPKGDITITDSSDNELMVIRGSNSYPDGYTGDKGVPTIGTGSFPGSIGNDFYIFRGDAIERPSGTALDDFVIDGEISVENNISTDTQEENQKLSIHEGNRDLTFGATVHGTTASHDKIDDLLKGDEDNIRWIADSSNSENLQIDNAELMSDGSRERNESDAKLTLDLEYSGDGITVDA